MEPIFREAYNTIAYEYELRADVTPEAFHKYHMPRTSSEQDIYKHVNYKGANDFLTNQEYTKFSEAYDILDSGIHKGIFYINTHETASSFLRICGISIPQCFYEVNETKLEIPNFYDFTQCKDYFITYTNSIWQMNILINEAFEEGYELLFRDPNSLVVEMKRKQKTYHPGF